MTTASFAAVLQDQVLSLRLFNTATLPTQLVTPSSLGLITVSFDILITPPLLFMTMGGDVLLKIHQPESPSTVGSRLPASVATTQILPWIRFRSICFVRWTCVGVISSSLLAHLTLPGGR